MLVVSDGTNARIGSLTANQEWFKVWRTIDGNSDAPKTALELEVLVRGVFEPHFGSKGNSRIVSEINLLFTKESVFSISHKRSPLF